MEDNYIKTPEACEILNCSRFLVYALIKSGHLKAFKYNRDWRLSKKSLEDYIQKRMNVYGIGNPGKN